MTWKEILDGKEITWDDINIRHGNARKLFNAMRDQAKQEMDKEHYSKVKSFRNFSEVPEYLKAGFAQNHQKWIDDWGGNSEELTKLEKAYDEEMNEHLERLYQYETMKSFPENKQEILKAVERQVLIDEIKKTREQNNNIVRMIS